MDIKVHDCIIYTGKDVSKSGYDIKKGQTGYVLEVLNDGTCEIDLMINDEESIQVNISLEDLKQYN